MADIKKEKQSGLNLDEVKKLIEILEKSTLEEIEVSHGDIHLKLVKPKAGKTVIRASSPQLVSTSAPSQEQGAAASAQKQADGAATMAAENVHQVKCPMVGTFYRAPAPNAEPFVKTGDIVKKGQTLCIVEAMKLMNEIECEIGGKILEIKVLNAEPVEYGEVLMLIETGI